MGEVRPIPTLGGVIRDMRGAGRALRVSWHREDGLVVLSLWVGPRCTGPVRVAAADVPRLIEALRIGLRSGPFTPPRSDETPGLDVVSGEPESDVATGNAEPSGTTGDPGTDAATDDDAGTDSPGPDAAAQRREPGSVTEGGQDGAAG